MNATYRAIHIPKVSITLDGNPVEPEWNKANLLRSFAFPWEDRPTPRTEFRALFDQYAFYFAFSVDDDDIVLAEPYGSKQDVVREDRVELFFAVDEELSEYYCMEIDPLGRVLDYRAKHYRRFDFSWTFPGLKTAGKIRDRGYSVEGVIPLRSFELLGLRPLLVGESIKFGVYRAEFRHSKGPDPIEGWISWIDPRTTEPDFHVPESFGYLRLMDGGAGIARSG